MTNKRRRKSAKVRKVSAMIKKKKSSSLFKSKMLIQSLLVRSART